MLNKANFDFTAVGQVQGIFEIDGYTLSYNSKWTNSLRHIELRGSTTDLNEMDEFLENCVSNYVLGEISAEILAIFALILSNKVSTIFKATCHESTKLVLVNEAVQGLFKTLLALVRGVKVGQGKQSQLPSTENSFTEM